MPEQDLTQFVTDDLSPFAQDVLKTDLKSAYTRLVVTGPGNPQARSLLDQATPERMVTGAVASREDARAMLAGLWLWHDWLDESHRISQELHSATGSFWHAIMHRREGDFSNSKYWYVRCADHPVLGMIYQNASATINPLPADKRLLRLVNMSWNPNAFVDLVQDVHDEPDEPLHRIAVSLQQLEWRMLFDHCTRAAAGK
jgi:hypothetical protein